MTKYSVKKPFTVLVGIVMVLVLGVVSFMGLNTDLLPSFDLPYVVVYTVYPGASPERVELSVTQPLEQAVATTRGLENINSMSNENVSIIIMEFNQETNMDSAMIELNNNIDMVSGYLDDMVQPPIMMKMNPDMLPVQMLSVDADGMDIKQLTDYVEKDLAPRLERIDGVAMVDVSGSVKDNVAIRFNQEKIDEINDSILKSVNNQLYKTKKELDSAKAKLNDSEAQLKGRRQQAYDNLSKASAELDAGQAQAQAIASEKAKLETQLGIYKGAKQLVGPLPIMRTADMALSTIIRIGAEYDIGINGETTLEQILAYEPVKPEIIPEEIWTELLGALGQLKGGVQSVIDRSEGKLTAASTLSQLQAFLSETINRIVSGLKSMGIAQEIIDTGSTILIDNKIRTLENELSRATLMAQQMEATLNSLKAAYAKLEAGKMEATANLAAAQVGLQSGKAQLDEGVKQFESARDNALKSANIDGLVTQDTLSAILMAQDFSMPAGYMTEGGHKLTVKVGEKFRNIDELKNLLLLDMGIDGVEPITLRDVADVTIEDNSANSYVRVNGNPAISLSIQKSSTASTSEVSDSVNKEVARIMAEDENIHIVQLMDQGIYINLVIDSVMDNLMYGGLIAIVVLWFFLKDWKPTIIIGISIPISLLFAVVMMYFSGVSLNTISLAGLALGVGMLVDNSIVVIENIYRLRSLGYSKVKAAVVGARQVRGAIISSTLTTICVFLPIVFTTGITRELFVDMALTIGYSLIASLIVALTVVPSFASSMLTTTKEVKPGLFDKMVAGYEKLLNKCLDHKWVVIVLTTGLLVFSFARLATMPLAFIPPMDSNQMQMTLSMPFETSKEDLIATSEKVAENVSQIEGIDTVGMTIGSGGMMDALSSSETKDMFFYIVLSEDKQHTNDEFADLIMQANPEYEDMLSVQTSNMDLGALGGSGIGIQIKGNDLDTLQSEAKKLSGILAGVEGIAEVDDGSSKYNEEIRIEVDKTKAMQKGLTVAQVFQKVTGALTESKKATTLTFEGKDMDAIIYAPADYTTETIGSLVVTTSAYENGKEKDVLLRDLASISTASSPDKINHSNQSRFITVSASIADGYNASLVSRDVEEALTGYEMPSGYSYSMTGENETIMEAMTEITKMILLAIIFIYLIMVAQFQSLKSPFIVLFTIPLAFTGGILALLMANDVISIISMIGFLVLAGVVVNNGIVFVDYVNTLRIEGMDKRSALIKTGHDRIRPILMTALTTILAMSTMAMGVGMGAELSQGMARVTIGGLSYATLLTLFLVPTLYDIFNRGDIKVINVEFDDDEK